MIRFIAGALAIFSVCGCSAPADGVDSNEPIGQDLEHFWSGSGWLDGGHATQTVGMAEAPRGSVYQWLTTGFVCRGNYFEPCAGATYAYSVPGGSYGAVMAVGIAQNTSHIYAWYSDGTVSQGTSDNFTAYQGKVPFTRPAKPGGGTFAMSSLIEADNSPNGQWYYYWADGSLLYRTTGTPRSADANTSAQQVTIDTSPSNILGIAFPGGSNFIDTYYKGGRLNESSSSLNLAQP